MRRVPQSLGQDGDRLDSWKEIAAYLGKDVRTAIRWSKDGGMPVYRHADGKRGAVYAYRSELDEWIHADRSDSFQPTRPPSYRKTIFVRVGASSALILVAIVSLFWLSSSSDLPNIPVEEWPWVLITDFDNRSGEAQFDATLEAALRRELANSRHVSVVPSERVRDTLSLMKRAPDVTIDADLGREICLRDGGIRALLTGRVEKFDSRYRLSLEVVDPAQGHTVASVEEAAVGEDEVPPAVDRLGDWLREHLDEALAQISHHDTPLEKVTTASLSALEFYSRGTRLLQGAQGGAAEVCFRQAVEEDPEFASAYLYLFWLLQDQQKLLDNGFVRGFDRLEWRSRTDITVEPALGDEARSFLERAMELADSASDQERHYIEGTYYEFIERNYEKACRSYKTTVEICPDHFWAAGNAAYVCGWRLGRRKDYVRAVVQAEQLSSAYTMPAAKALSLLAGDFDQARPYVERLRKLIAAGEVSGRWGGAHAFTELFSAEECLAKGLLTEVVSELQRLELARVREGSYGSRLAGKLFSFYLTLGQFRKARALAQETGGPRQHRIWWAFLAGDQAAFREHLEDFRRDQLRVQPDPTKRLIANLGRNMGIQNFRGGPPTGWLAPLYDAESAVETVLAAGEPAPAFLSLPAFEAKLQLLRGKQMLAQGQLDDGIALLESGLKWFRDNGLWPTLQYYFLGAELLATGLAERGHLMDAYWVLREAAEQTRMVSSNTAFLHQRIQLRRALLARKLENRTAEAGAIEAELKNALRFADQDHPILVQIREQQDELVKIE